MEHLSRRASILGAPFLIALSACSQQAPAAATAAYAAPSTSTAAALYPAASTTTSASSVHDVSNTLKNPADDNDLSSLGSDAECVENKDGAPSFGSPQDNGRFYLCREPVDGYWNDWYGARKDGDPLVLNVVAEGKTSSFDGELHVDCKAGTARWIRGSTMMEESASPDQIREEVPARAVAYARRYICG